VCRLRGALERGGEPSGETRRLGGYELQSEIARGGMGVVYRARRSADGATVAVKLLTGGELASAESRRRFLREAEAAAALEHEAIVRTHEAGEHEGQAYLVMELVTGGTLAESARHLPYAPPRSAALVEQIARAVAYAHSRGVLHRDLKPSNILLDAAGRPQVADFGLARRMDHAAASELTVSGQVLGSPAYMSPEQAAGRTSLIGVRSDVYSLGAILYWLLAGRPPFEGESVHEILAQTEKTDPAPPGKFRQGVPRDLEAICLKCLEKKPAHRYTGPAELADELSAFLRGERVRARVPGPAKRLLRWCGRHPAVSGLSAALLIALAGGGVWLRLTQQREQQMKSASREQEWTSLLQAVEKAHTDRTPGHRAAGLGLVKRAAAVRVTPELRDHAIRLLARPDVALAGPPFRLPPGTGAVAVDAAFKIAAAARDGKIFLHRLPGGEVEAELDEAASREPDGGAPAELEFSRDGRLLAVQSAGGQLRVWDHSQRSPGDAGQPAVLAAPPRFAWRTHASQASGFAPVFSSDGKHLCVRAAAGASHPRGALLLVEAATGQEKVIAEGQAPSAFFAIRPGTTTVSVVEGNRLRLINSASGEVLRELPQRTRLTSLAWSENGERFAAGTADGALQTWSRFDEFSREGKSVPHAAAIVRVFYNTGRYALTQSADGTVRLSIPGSTDEIVAEGRNLTALGIAPDQPRGACLTGDREIVVWRRVGAPFLATLGGRVGRGFEGWHIEMDAAGRWLLMQSGEYISLLETKTWRAAEIPAAPPAGAFFAAGGTQCVTFDSSGWRTAALPSGGTLSPDLLQHATPLPSAARTRRLCLSADGKSFLMESPQGAYLTGAWPDLEAARELSGRRASDTPAPPGSPTGSGALAMNPDGTLAAAGLPLEGGAVVWNARSGAVVREFSETGSVLFSPDGKWFLLGGAKIYRLFDTTAWREQWSLTRENASQTPGVACFSPDGATIVLDRHQRGLHMVDTLTGALRMILTPPITQPSTSLRFQPGTDTIFAGTPGNQIWLWNLPRLRQELQKLGVTDGF